MHCQRFMLPRRHAWLACAHAVAGLLHLKPPHPHPHTPHLPTPLRFLPALMGGVEWSPEVHAAFPPAFCQAARTMLLINACRGFGAAGEQAGVQLPADMLLRILREAARPMLDWVPEPQAMCKDLSRLRRRLLIAAGLGAALATAAVLRFAWRRQRPSST